MLCTSATLFSRAVQLIIINSSNLFVGNSYAYRKRLAKVFEHQKLALIPTPNTHRKASVIMLVESFVASLSASGISAIVGLYGRGDVLLIVPFQQYLLKHC